MRSLDTAFTYDSECSKAKPWMVPVVCSSEYTRDLVSDNRWILVKFATPTGFYLSVGRIERLLRIEGNITAMGGHRFPVDWYTNQQPIRNICKPLKMAICSLWKADVVNGPGMCGEIDDTSGQHIDLLKISNVRTTARGRYSANCVVLLAEVVCRLVPTTLIRSEGRVQQFFMTASKASSR
jgi:hypothetical protein